MLKQILVTAMAATLTMGVALAGQTPNAITIHAGKTAANNGQHMYASYCAPCHGTDGKGNGPAAGALKLPPPDLTTLSKNNHGKFPGSHVVTVLQFGSEMPAHGSAQMPVWGPILSKMNRTNPQEKQLRMSNLSRYLETIQVN